MIVNLPVCEKVISNDASAKRSNKVIAPGRCASSKGSIMRSSMSWGEDLGVVIATLLAPGSGPVEALLLLVQLGGKVR